MDTQPIHDLSNTTALPPAPPAGKPAPVPVVLPRYTPLILSQRRPAPAPAPALAPDNEAPPDPPALYWVHWTYTDDEWLAWATQERASTRPEYESYQALTSVVGMGLLLVALSAGGLLAVGSLAPSSFLAVFMLIAGVILFFGLVGPSRQSAKAEALYRLRREGPREIAVGPWWVWQAGEAMPLLYHPYSRLTVQLTTQPVLQLVFTIDERAPSSRYNAHRKITVLVPPGHEAEARHLITRFQHEVINTPAAANPHRQEPTPPRPRAPIRAPAITVRLPALPPLPTDADTQRFDGDRKGR